MAQAKRNNVTKTAKKQTRSAKQKEAQQPSSFFLISMSFLAATLLFVNLVMLNV